MKHIKIFITLYIFILPFLVVGQAAEKARLSLNLKYYNNNNKVQYLVANAKAKIDGKFQQIAKIPVSIYISNDSSKDNLLGTGITNEKGEFLILIPPTAKQEWDKTKSPTFVAKSKATDKFDEAEGDVTITKAKIQIDTADGRIINAKVLELKDTNWVPVKGVDLTIGVKRLGGSLNVNETQTYTTDSLGQVSAEFKRDSLPGDNLTNKLTLIATVADNDTYGNITTELPVNWGVSETYISNFNHRTLFSRRGHSPIWLEFLAYGIIIVVWGTLIYLLNSLVKIYKLGKES